MKISEWLEHCDLQKQSDLLEEKIASPPLQNFKQLGLSAGSLGLGLGATAGGIGLKVWQDSVARKAAAALRRERLIQRILGLGGVALAAGSLGYDINKKGSLEKIARPIGWKGMLGIGAGVGGAGFLGYKMLMKHQAQRRGALKALRNAKVMSALREVAPWTLAVAGGYGLGSGLAKSSALEKIAGPLSYFRAGDILRKLPASRMERGALAAGGLGGAVSALDLIRSVKSNKLSRLRNLMRATTSFRARRLRPLFQTDSMMRYSGMPGVMDLTKITSLQKTAGPLSYFRAQDILRKLPGATAERNKLIGGGLAGLLALGNLGGSIKRARGIRGLPSFIRHPWNALNFSSAIAEGAGAGGLIGSGLKARSARVQLAHRIARRRQIMAGLLGAGALGAGATFGIPALTKKSSLEAARLGMMVKEARGVNAGTIGLSALAAGSFGTRMLLSKKYRAAQQMARRSRIGALLGLGAGLTGLGLGSAALVQAKRPME